MQSDVSPAQTGSIGYDSVDDDDRRDYPRQLMDGTVLVIPRGDPLDRFWATTADISRGGMFIHTVMQLPVYAELRARIHLKDGPVVRAHARVSRQEEGRGFGCYFTALEPEAARDLNGWLGPTGGLSPTAGVIID
ncbi:MAG: PilZ domain-containing protein [Deltaproteobacteria bacterium]|nr:PilZ domain-containing protein [Deltaproteobacteria bacterium]